MILFRSRRQRRFLTQRDIWYFRSCRCNVFWRAWEDHWRGVLYAEVTDSNKFGLN